MQRYAIFNKSNKILITKTPDIDKQGFNGEIINCTSEVLKNTNFDEYFDERCTTCLLLACEQISIEEVFIALTKRYYFVLAAGGIVQNEKGEILFMFRNGNWDLPKGHWEKGESLEYTAKREVIEECGINELELGQFLCFSYHTYTMFHRPELKRISWYLMHCSSSEQLSPQIEEGIEKLCWVSREELDTVLSQSYPNIQNIFREIKLLGVL